MGKLIIAEDGSTFKCDLDIKSQYSQPVFIPSSVGVQNPFIQSIPTTNEVTFSIPLNNTNQQIIDKHFKQNHNYRGIYNNFKKDLFYINDCRNYKICGFYMTNLSWSNYNGNQTIDIEGQCDHFTVEYDLDIDYKRKLRKKKLERICNVEL